MKSTDEIILKPNTYVVSFFGHHSYDKPERVEKKLKEEVERLIREKEHITFLVGFSTKFDLKAAAAVNSTIRKLQCKNVALLLVLTPKSKNLGKEYDGYAERYDDAFKFIKCSKFSTYKTQALARNEYMVKLSQCIICCVQKRNDVNYKSVCYAKERGKEIINVGYDRWSEYDPLGDIEAGKPTD